MYKIVYNTGAGDFVIDGTLDEAMRKADEAAAYTQENIEICDASEEVVALRSWWGCTTGIEEEEDPISFGDFGFYGDWVVLD